MSNTKLWINNDENFYNILVNKTKLVDRCITKTTAVYEILRELPSKTPDGHRWNADDILDLVDEQHNEKL